MKVIKEGKRPLREMKAKCSLCECIFSFDCSDVRYEADMHHQWRVTCPICGHDEALIEDWDCDYVIDNNDFLNLYK